jgi:hypothetical protein
LLECRTRVCKLYEYVYYICVENIKPPKRCSCQQHVAQCFYVWFIQTPLPTEMKACSRSFEVLKLSGSRHIHVNMLRVFCIFFPKTLRQLKGALRNSCEAQCLYGSVRFIQTPLPTDMKACSRSVEVLKLGGSRNTHVSML